MHRIVCAYKNCSKGAALARGDITKGYATYVRLVILLLMKLSPMNYHGYYWHPAKREELSWKAKDNDDYKDSSLANSI